MFRIGVGQIKNTNRISENFETIWRVLESFEKAPVELVLFPECALTGFSGHLEECTMERLTPMFEKVQQWSDRTSMAVVLPCAVSMSGKLFNSGFFFADKRRVQFVKHGLTESETSFFSGPEGTPPKIFTVGKVRCALLICREAELPPWTYFNKAEADLILWPGYWGWGPEDGWSQNYKIDKPNRVFENMKAWGIPLVQANFACNDLGDARGEGPSGLSVFINSSNQLVLRGGFKTEETFRAEVLL